MKKTTIFLYFQVNRDAFCWAISKKDYTATRSSTSHVSYLVSI